MQNIKLIFKIYYILIILIFSGELYSYNEITIDDYTTNLELYTDYPSGNNINTTIDTNDTVTSLGSLQIAYTFSNTNIENNGFTWVKTTWKYIPYIDLTGYEELKFYIKGDGSNNTLKIQLVENNKLEDGNGEGEIWELNKGISLNDTNWQRMSVSISQDISGFINSGSVSGDNVLDYDSIKMINYLIVGSDSTVNNTIKLNNLQKVSLEERIFYLDYKNNYTFLTGGELYPDTTSGILIKTNTDDNNEIYKRIYYDMSVSKGYYYISKRLNKEDWSDYQGVRLVFTMSTNEHEIKFSIGVTTSDSDLTYTTNPIKVLLPVKNKLRLNFDDFKYRGQSIRDNLDISKITSFTITISGEQSDTHYLDLYSGQCYSKITGFRETYNSDIISGTTKTIKNNDIDNYYKNGDTIDISFTSDFIADSIEVNFSFLDSSYSSNKMQVFTNNGDYNIKYPISESNLITNVTGHLNISIINNDVKYTDKSFQVILNNELTPVTGGIVKLDSDTENIFFVILPSNSIQEKTEFNISKKEDITVPIGSYSKYTMKIIPDNIMLNKSAKIFIQYNPLDFTGQENNLSIFKYEDGNWNSINSEIYLSGSNRYIIGYTNQFGIFTLGIRTFNPEKTLENVKVLPNPFTPNGDGYNDLTTFYLDSILNDEDIHIRIYNLKGELVNKMSGGGSVWDGTDNNHEKLPVGVYIYSIEASNKYEKGIVTLLR